MTEAEIKRKAIEVLKAGGYVFWFPPFPANKTAQRDIFGVFDFVALLNSARGILTETIFVQLTTIQHVSDRRRKIIQFLGDNYVELPNAWIWAWDKLKNEFRFIKVYEEYV